MQRKKRNNTAYGIPALLMTALLLASPGCLSVHTHLKDVLTSAKPMEKEEYELIGDGEGMHSSFRLFWFIPVTPRTDREKAIEEAVAAKGGDNLVFVRIWQERQYWILGTVDIIHVRGRVIRYRE